MNDALRKSGRVDTVLILLLSLCAVRLWVMPSLSSFWTDEMVTAFIVEKGANHPSLSVAPQVTKSIYYALPSFTTGWFGGSEALYRLPSLLAMAAAVFFIARLSQRLIHPASGWLAVFACFALPGMNYPASDARPYGLGICVTAAALYSLVCWLDSGLKRHAFAFIVLASLLWRVHLIYWPVYLLFFVYLVYRILRKETSVRPAGAALVFGLICLSLIPVFKDALEILRNFQDHVVTAPPSVERFIRSLKPYLIACCVAVAWIVKRWSANPGFANFFGGPIRLELSKNPQQSRTASGWLLILGWWVCQPLCLLIVSHLAGMSVFLERYLSASFPGAILVAIGAAGSFLSASQWKHASAVLGLCALLFFGQWTRFWPEHDPSGWRSAVSAIESMKLGAETPVLCPSPFIEARPPVWQEDYPAESFLYSHLCAYPVSGKPYTLPYEFSEDAKAHVRRLSRETLIHSDRFLIYGGERIVSLWCNWFASQPDFAGWETREMDFGKVSVAEIRPRRNRAVP